MEKLRFGLRVALSRERLGITQAELSRRSGLSKAIISQIENEKVYAVSTETVKKLAKALKVSPVYLFRGVC